MRLAHRVAIVLLGATIATTTFVVPAEGNMNAPVWTVGDYWTYSLWTEWVAGSVQQTVTGVETVTVGGVSYTAHRLQVESRFVENLPGGSWINMSGAAWYRTSDLAFVAQNTSGTIDIPPLPFTLLLKMYVSFDPPEDIQWPLQTGGTWSTSGVMSEAQQVGGQPWSTGNSTFDHQFVVEPARTVSVPAGTFLTHPLNGSGPDGSYNATFWAPAVGNVAYATGFDVRTSDHLLLELTDFLYQRAANDATPPVLSGVSADPTSQVQGAQVTVRATVVDDIAVASVSLNVTEPDGRTTNRTMAWTAGDDYSVAATWTQVGSHTYVVWALDQAGNAAGATGSFAIFAPDTAAPTIADLVADPQSAEAPAAVTVSATVTDDDRVASVSVNVSLPDGAYLNATMIAGTSDRYEYTSVWAEVGEYAFTVWALDPSGNVASGSGSFTIIAPDTTPPTIVHAPRGVVYVGEEVRVVATVSDAGQVLEVRLIYTPVGGTEQNVTMVRSGNEYAHTIPAQTAVGTVRYRVYAVDASGNGNLTVEYVLGVQARPSAPALDFGLLMLIAIVAAVVLSAVLLAARTLGKRKAAEAGVGDAGPAGEATPTRRCPGCGALVDLNDVACFLCGARL